MNTIKDNAIKSLSEIAAAIDGETKRDFVVPRQNLRVQEDGNTVVVLDRNGDDVYETLPINSHARGQLNQSIAPGFDRYARHLIENGHTAEYAGQVNFNLRNEGDKRALLRTRENGEPAHIRAVVSDAYKTIDDDLVFGSALPLIADRLDDFRALGGRRTETQTQLRIISRSPLGQVGDRRLYGGFSIRNSEVGCGFARFEAFLFDSFCENGCIFGKRSIADVKWAHRGARISTDFGQVLEARWKQAELDSIRGAVVDATQLALSSESYSELFALSQSAWSDGIDERTLGEGGVSGVIERVGKQLGLTKTEVETAKVEFRGGENNRYGVQAAITQAAQRIDSYDRRVDLERAGGDLLGWDSKQWERVALLAA